ncbi:hypothetical protein ACFGRT_006790, partial [Pseudomonas aeruginosa]
MNKSFSRRRVPPRQRRDCSGEQEGGFAESETSEPKAEIGLNNAPAINKITHCIGCRTLVPRRLQRYPPMPIMLPHRLPPC